LKHWLPTKKSDAQHPKGEDLSYTNAEACIHTKWMLSKENNVERTTDST
jgi:hypothetical protein